MPHITLKHFPFLEYILCHAHAAEVEISGRSSALEFQRSELFDEFTSLSW